MLRETRAVVAAASAVKLFDLVRMDDRIRAHLDGLAVASPDASEDHGSLLPEESTSGAAFVAVASALDSGAAERIHAIIAKAAGDDSVCRGVIWALAWADRRRLRGVVADLLASEQPVERRIGVTACASHRVDSGLVSARRFEDSDAGVRARAYRSAAEIGLREFVSTLARAADDNSLCRAWSAWAAVLLGDRQEALTDVEQVAAEAGVLSRRALQLFLLAANPSRAHELLRDGATGGVRRTRIRGAGAIGDSQYVPWLIAQMADNTFARLAGESFSMITGLDLWQPPFFRAQPQDFESGPTDNPDDENVELDEDEGLPWPDQAQVQAWWNQHGARFTTGIRHFMGAPPGRAHCIEVLKNGYQRQRIAAAYHLCLLNPGTPLFEWRAPAWRQQRELAQMS